MITRRSLRESSFCHQTCLKNINAGAPFPGCREDFQTDAAWQYWKTLETTHLQQLVVAMVSYKPELAKSTPVDPAPNYGHGNARPATLYSYDSPRVPSRHVSSASRTSLFNPHDRYGGSNNGHDGDDDDVEAGDSFTFIPPNPKKFYKRLLELCLLADLEVMMSPEVDDNDEVSLGILSSYHLDLLNECAIRWRIDHPYRVSCFLDLVRQFYERGEVPLECIPEALQNIQKIREDTDLDQWPVQDVSCSSWYIGYIP